MGKVTGFLEYDRQEQKYQLAGDRIRHFREFTLPLDTNDLRKQAARCMDCGIPFCHGPTGCPVHNQIPDWNELVCNDNWEEAARNLHSQPGPKKDLGPAIADRAWDMGWVRPEIPEKLTGKRVAVIGSGPAGLAAAQQLARVGHEVHVFEREGRPGGL